MKSRPGGAVVAAAIFWIGSLTCGWVWRSGCCQERRRHNIKSDGTVDWYTYSGYRRYHSECHVYHGPDGMGSSYAPSLRDSLKTLSYNDFVGVVAGGRKNVNTAQENVMPALGTNKNVMCHVDDIFVYLRARANDAVGRVRPEKHQEKPESARKWEDSCMAMTQ